LGEVGIEVGYLSTLKAGSGSYSCGVLRVLTDLADDPLFLVVDAPYSTFMLEAGSSGLGGGMDAPLVVEGELLDNASSDEGGEGMFEDGSCSTGPYWGPLSLERDRRGGIEDGLVGH